MYTWPVGLVAHFLCKNRFFAFHFHSNNLSCSGRGIFSWLLLNVFKFWISTQVLLLIPALRLDLFLAKFVIIAPVFYLVEKNLQNKLLASHLDNIFLLLLILERNYPILISYILKFRL